MFILVILMVIAGLAGLAIHITRTERHPGAGATVWILVFVLLSWVLLLWPEGS